MRSFELQDSFTGRWEIVRLPHCQWSNSGVYGWAPSEANGNHYSDVTMGAMVSQITSLTIVYSIIYSGANQTKHQSSESLALMRGKHRWPVNSPYKWPVKQKMFPFDDVIMTKDNTLRTVCIILGKQCECMLVSTTNQLSWHLVDAG